MKKLLISTFLFSAIFIIACGNLGKEITVSLLLPIDYDGVCGDYDENEDYDYTYCITPDDEITISIYGKNSLNEEFTFIKDKKIQVSESQKHIDIINTPLYLSGKKYNRLFVKVMNGQKLKLTGGADYLQDSAQTNIFLAPAGDFARVVSDRSHSDKSSLESYISEDGSKGSAAVALTDGRIYMTGGYDLANEENSDKAVIFDMNTTEVKNIRKLPFPVHDHIAALLDDGSETGTVIVGLGTSEDNELNDSVWVYDPKSDKYELLAIGAPAMTKAKALTINGDVYIVGGCTDSGASNAVYKISAKTGSVTSETFATLKTGRCNHALADVSTANEVRILVIGGSTDAREEKETPVTGENFAELVTLGSSTTMAVADRNGGDDAELKAKGLISPAAASVVMDDKEKSETVVSVIGGYNRDSEDSWSTNPYIFAFSWKGENTLVYDKSTTTFECARPSAATLGTGAKSPFKYVAVNCGTKEISRTGRYASNQVIFVLQVKRVKDSDLGIEVFSSSVKESLMDENQDPDSDAEIVDGPVAVNGLGQVFMLGGKYVYLVGSYEVPGTLSSQASAKLPSKPIIHVAFKNAFSVPMSYRNIYDKVDMDLSATCVSDPNDPERCLENWQDHYYIRYKWEMTESPTPLLDQSKLQLAESDSSAGQWLPDDGKRDNPKRATFTGLMITPRRYPGEANPTYNAEKCSSECGTEPVYDKDNPDDFLFLKLSDYLVCRQKYCEENRSKYYKVNIQAETVDKATGLVSDTADITVVPEIIPQARVVAQLSYKQGYRTKAEAESKDGVAVDLDLKLIKKNSLEAPQYGFTPTEGLLGTSYRPTEMDAACPVTMPECEKYWRHDDCSFGDQGLEGIDDGRTIQWHASLDIDNTWGGNNYETPETIGLGPIADYDGDGRPDVDIIDDQYLVVVGYVNCISTYSDGDDRCDERYAGENSAYEVDARVEILIDGDEAPRKAGKNRPADNYASTTKDFKIKVNEWKAIAVVKWDNGDAIVTDTAMPDENIEIDPVNHPVCTYDMSDAVLIPIWDADTYRSHITTPDYDGRTIGSCD